MNYKMAVETLHAGCDRDTQSQCLREIYETVEPLCNTPTAPEGETSLYDWLAEGDWSGKPDADDFAENIAAEWDALTEDELFPDEGVEV